MDLPQALHSVAVDLDRIDASAMFFGASVLEAYIDRKEMLDEELRPTEDVDVVLLLDRGGRGRNVAVAVEQELQRQGWRHDLRPDRKNPHAFISPSGVPVDIVMDRLYPQDDWVIRASEAPEELSLGPGRTIRIPTPAYFLACKVAASRNLERWEGQYYSHDLEDMSVLLAGCSTLLLSAEAGPPELRENIATWAIELLRKDTPYGEAAHALVLDNAPRAADVGEIEALLNELARLAG